jgi:rhodanese-related sulfurtransferase
MERVEPDVVWERLSRGEPLGIVDLRQPDDVLADPRRLPNAVRLSLDELEARHDELPRQHEIVLYCSCPNEVSAARAALRLKRLGFARVSPLRGGLAGWHAAALPFHGQEEAREVSGV